MNPVEASPSQLVYWHQEGGLEVFERVVIGGPAEAPDVIPCPALVTRRTGEPLQVHVAFKLDEVELAALAQGGTLWLTTWGHLPIHRLEVQEPAPRNGGGSA